MNRPIGVTFLGIIVLFTALINGLRLCEVVFFWRVLEKYQASPIYLALCGVIWLFVGGILTLGMLRRKSRVWAGTITGISCYTVWYWVDRSIVETPHSNWPFALAFTVILLGASAAILFSKNTKIYLHLFDPKI